MKTIDDANLLDDIFMNLVASDPDVGEEFCKTLLSVLLQKEIGSVHVLVQRVIPGTGEGLRGVRLDVEIAEADKNNPKLTANVYDIEPHIGSEPDLFKMMRFRQAKIDSRYMKAGDNDFSHLPNLYVILITNFDPFGEDFMLYTVKNTCVEVPELICGDGLRFLYFNTKGRKGGSEAIQNMLEYMQNSRASAAVDDATKEVDKCVNNVRLDPDVRGKYMTFGDKIDKEKELSYKEGQDKLLIKLVCSRMLRGMTAREIAEDLETEEPIIAQICKAAEKCSPSYDPDAIFQALQTIEI